MGTACGSHCLNKYVDIAVVKMKPDLHDGFRTIRYITAGLYKLSYLVLEVIRNLKIANCAHHISRGSGIADELKAFMFMEPMPPPDMLCPRPGNANSALVTEAAAKERSQYQLDLAKWQAGPGLGKKQRAYDGVAVANAIAATCGSVISFLIDKEATARGAKWQPHPLWKYLEAITKAALTPAKQHLEEQLSTARQGATESIDVYIDRIERMHAG